MGWHSKKQPGGTARFPDKPKRVMETSKEHHSTDNNNSSADKSFRDGREERHNDGLHYKETIEPNGDIKRIYDSGLVRISDPVTGAYTRVTLGDEDPYHCRVCGKKLKDTDVVTVCEDCDKADMKLLEESLYPINLEKD